MIDFDQLLLLPIYARLGVSAVLTTSGSDGDDFDVTVIDKSHGVQVALGDLSVPTMRPAAVVRAAELTGLGVDLLDLDEGEIAFNGQTWTITSHSPKPGPEGEGKGEIYLFLTT